MSIDHSDQLHLPDAPDLDPSLEASVVPKFDMCLFRSTLTEKHVEKFSQIYVIPLDLHPHAPPAGFTMDQLSTEFNKIPTKRILISVSRKREHDQQKHNQQERYLNCQQERLNAISRNDT
ncbi:hypothetical protein Tco_0386440 [Tanacetum coccineum]